MEYSRHPYSTFCFTELRASDVDAAGRFYGELLGWTTVPVSEISICSACTART